ncbi:MAG: GIY-YIG nuclease family protein [Gammaproteobacteria bacterium]|nr:GIY-YIG nuclease family protein [Gammaproteobacteria bacterium]
MKSMLRNDFYSDKLKIKSKCIEKGCGKFAIDFDAGLCGTHLNHMHMDEEQHRKLLNKFDPTSHIYFAYAPEVNRVKIGKSDNVTDRIPTLRIGSPVEMILICAMQLDFKYEKIFHEFFKDDRYRGEWFEFDVDIVELIRLFNRKGSEGVMCFFEYICGIEYDK